MNWSAHAAVSDSELKRHGLGDRDSTVQGFEAVYLIDEKEVAQQTAVGSDHHFADKARFSALKESRNTNV